MHMEKIASFSIAKKDFFAYNCSGKKIILSFAQNMGAIHPRISVPCLNSIVADVHTSFILGDLLFLLPHVQVMFTHLSQLRLSQFWSPGLYFSNHSAWSCPPSPHIMFHPLAGEHRPGHHPLLSFSPLSPISSHYKDVHQDEIRVQKTYRCLEVQKLHIGPPPRLKLYILVQHYKVKWYLTFLKSNDSVTAGPFSGYKEHLKWNCFLLKFVVIGKSQVEKLSNRS